MSCQQETPQPSFYGNAILSRNIMNATVANGSVDISGWKYYFAYSVFLSVCAGVPSNAFIIACAFRFAHIRAGHVVPLLYHYFILSISAADLVFLIFQAAPSALQAVFGVKMLAMNIVLCRFSHFSTYVSTISSSISLLCLNVDKFIAIVKPLHHAALLTRGRVVATVVSCWVVSASVATFYTFGPFTSVRVQTCRMEMSPGAYMTFSALFFICPIFASGILSSVIAVVVAKSKRKHGKFDLTPRRQRRHKKRVNKIAFVFSTTLWSCLSCLPFRIYWFVRCTRPTGKSHTGVAVGYFVYSLLMMHPTGNAVVTLLVQRRYRAAVKGVFGWITPGRKNNNKLKHRIDKQVDQQDGVKCTMTQTRRIAVRWAKSTKNGTGMTMLINRQSDSFCSDSSFGTRRHETLD